MEAPRPDGETTQDAPWPTLDDGMQKLRDIRQALIGDYYAAEDKADKWMTSEFPSVVNGEEFTVATENAKDSILIMGFGKQSYRFTMVGDELRLHPSKTVDREPGKPTVRVAPKIVDGLASFTETVWLNRSADNAGPNYHAYDELFTKLSQQQKALTAIGLMATEEPAEAEPDG